MIHMKKITLTIFAGIIISISCLFCSCAGKNTDADNEKYVTEQESGTKESMVAAEILDYNTGKVLSNFDGNNQEKIVLMADCIAQSDSNIVESVSVEPMYIIHSIDRGNSIYDGWFNIYIDGDTVYVKADESKDTEINQMFGSDIYKSNNNAKDFMKLLN